MRARAHMAQVLEGTGLYSLTGSTPVGWELDAYSAGFAPLEAAFDKLLADLFAATATQAVSVLSLSRSSTRRGRRRMEQ